MRFRLYLLLLIFVTWCSAWSTDIQHIEKNESEHIIDKNISIEKVLEDIKKWIQSKKLVTIESEFNYPNNKELYKVIKTWSEIEKAYEKKAFTQRKEYFEQQTERIKKFDELSKSDNSDRLLTYRYGQLLKSQSKNNKSQIFYKEKCLDNTFSWMYPELWGAPVLEVWWQSFWCKNSLFLKKTDSWRVVLITDLKTKKYTNICLSDSEEKVNNWIDSTPWRVRDISEDCTKYWYYFTLSQ
jgi:hypothetical protein